MKAKSRGEATGRGRVIVCKVGLDGHTTGAAVVASGLRDAGFTVINLGTRVTPEQAVNAAIQEDVDVLGLSILSGAHVHLTRRVLEIGRARGMTSAVIVGGTIPDSDAEVLRAAGAAAVFGPGAAIPSIVEQVDGIVARRRGPAPVGA
jgi:methylmalonyl-CoA mutase C-terminal domain/subunit